LTARREKVDRDFSYTSRLYELWVEDVTPESSALALACLDLREALQLTPARLWAGVTQNESLPPGLPADAERLPYMAAILAARPELSELELAPAGRPLRLSGLADSFGAGLSL
jgi:hypothetical protein